MTTQPGCATTDLLPDMEPPMARQAPTDLVTHGHTRVDEFHWLRDDTRKDPEMLAYLNAENAYTKAAMAPVKALEDKLFEEIKSRLEKDDSSVPYRLDGFWYYHRYEKGREYPIHCRRKGSMDAAEEVILDVNELAKGHKYYAIAKRTVSDSTTKLAFAQDAVSRRIYTVRFKDLATGKLLDDAVEGTSGAVAWAADNQTVFYVKRDPKTLRAYAVYRHALGTKQSEDVLVFEERDDTFWVTLGRSKSKRFVVIESSSTLSTEVQLIEAAQPTDAPRPVLKREAKHEYEVAHHQDTLYIRTNWQAQNFRLMAAPVGSSSKDDWKEVIPNRDTTLLMGVEVFNDYLVVAERQEALRRLRAIKWSDKSEHAIPFEEPLYTVSPTQNYEFGTTKLRFSYSSPVTPNSIYEYDLATRERKLLKRDKIVGAPYDPADYVLERHWATARDGQKVPISLVYKKGFVKDGSGPLYQYAYGSYGYSLDPGFRISRISLLDRGFAVAVAHVRGGQELGRRWYEDGKLANKNNSFTDFIDCTEYLIEQGISRPERIVAEGASAGGLLMGAIANMRPDLYHGIHAGVPFVDVVSTMLDDSIPLTTFEYDEWGNPNIEKWYKTMLAYSPYDNVKALPYPHILITTGLHDSQVQYFEPAKWTARLRARKTNDDLVLLHTDMSTGHGGASGRYKRYRDVARVYAFFLYVLDMTD